MTDSCFDRVAHRARLSSRSLKWACVALLAAGACGGKGGGTESGSGTTIVNGPATFFDANNETFTLDGRTLELRGSGHTGAFSGDTLQLNNGAAFKIDAGVTFTDVTASGSAFNIASSAGSGTLNVAGTFTTICDHFCGANHGNMKMTIVVE